MNINTYIYKALEELGYEMRHVLHWETKKMEAPDKTPKGEDPWEVELEANGKYDYKRVKFITSDGVYCKDDSFYAWRELSNSDLAFYADKVCNIDHKKYYSYQRRFRRLDKQITI